MDPNHVINANVVNQNENEQPRRILGSYTAPSPNFYGNSIVVPPIAANNFELKPQLVTLVQQNCGSLHMKKTLKETAELIELVANNQYLYSSYRNLMNSGAAQKKGVLEVSAVSDQNAPQEAPYDMNGGFTQGENYEYAQFYPEQVNFMGNASKNPNNDPYAKTFHQEWRNHPKLGWKEQLQRPQNFNNPQGIFQQNNFNNRQFQSSQPQDWST
ncbi:hypothetical protein AHAS_Ahas04G0166000 [Arachis hypogaea]